MIPISLAITKFGSFKETQVFRFPEAAGLYFMTGVNEVEPRLQGNASGKTTLWNALTWVGFGKIADGLKAGDVCNWDAEKGTEVEFSYAQPGIDCVWTVKRTWSPNTWTLRHDAEFITDEEVVDLTKSTSNAYLADLRLEFSTWLNTVLIAQGEPMFLDLKKDAQAALFSDVMQLDRWLDYSARASKRASETDKTIRNLERDLAELRGQLSTVVAHDFKTEAASWEKKRTARLTQVEIEHKELVEKGKKLKAELIDAEALEDDKHERLALLTKGADLKSSLDLSNTEVATLTTDLAVRRSEVAAILAHIDQLEGRKVCPVCEQELSTNLRADQFARSDAALSKTNIKISELQSRILGMTARRDREQKELDAATDARIKARDELDDAARTLAAVKRSYYLNERELDRIEDQAEDITKEANPFEVMQRTAQARAQDLAHQQSELQDKLDAANERYSILSYWVRGFKEIRLVQIAEALTELEVEVNSCVTALGLVDWELRFQVDRETKGGNVQRGFSVFVRSPNNKREVPFEAWSGGETQRLRVAGNMGLANLIRSRTGATIDLEVWDEPTTGLSPQGVRDLLEALADRARIEKRCIWLVDHQSYDFGGFAGGAVITKTSKGSVISQH